MHGILSLIECRKMVSNIRNAFNVSIESGKLFYLPYSVTQDYIEVFQKNADRLGSLPPALSAKVAEIYVHIKGIVEDLKMLDSGTLHKWDPEFSKSFLANLVDAVERVKKMAEELIPLLQKESRCTIWN